MRCDPASCIGCCSLCDKIPNLQYLHLIHLRGDGGIDSKQYVGSNFLNFLLWWAELIGLETWLSSPLLDNPCFMALEMEKPSLGGVNNTEDSCFLKLKSPAASSLYRVWAE